MPVVRVPALPASRQHRPWEAKGSRSRSLPTCVERWVELQVSRLAQPGPVQISGSGPTAGISPSKISKCFKDLLISLKAGSEKS